MISRRSSTSSDFVEPLITTRFTRPLAVYSVFIPGRFMIIATFGYVKIAELSKKTLAGRDKSKFLPWNKN
jgi:hypothetical protein